MVIVVREGRFLVERLDDLGDAGWIVDAFVRPEQLGNAVGDRKSVAAAVADQRSGLLVQRGCAARAGQSMRDRLFGGVRRRLGQQEISNAQHVESARHERLVGLAGRTHDRFPAEVEAGIDQDRAAGLRMEALHQPAQPPVAFGVHRLDARREIHVGDCGNDRARRSEPGEPAGGARFAGIPPNPAADRRDDQHVRAFLAGAQLEVPVRVLRKHDRRKRPETLAKLHLHVDSGLHLGIASVGDDAAEAERTRAELHAALEPADHLAGVEGCGDLVEQLRFARVVRVARSKAVEAGPNLVVPVSRAEGRSPLPVGGVRAGVAE